MAPKHNIDTTKAASDVDRGPDSNGDASVVNVAQLGPAQLNIWKILIIFHLQFANEFFIQRKFIIIFKNSPAGAAIANTDDISWKLEKCTQFIEEIC